MAKRIPRRTFGKTNHRSSATIFGGYALNTASKEQANHVLDMLREYGVNHIDTAPSYGNSEELIGEWMKDHQKDFFLGTKIDKRTYEKAKTQIHNSLNRLHVDQIDLIQFHNLTNPNDWQTVFGENGALKAAKEARSQDLVKYIGVTGHGLNAPNMHRRSLRAFDFDSVLLPLNYPLLQNSNYAQTFHALLEKCKEHDVAVQTIKGIARRRWNKNEEHTTNTWYKPLQSHQAINRAVHWCLSFHSVFLITAGDIDLLPKILEAANRFQKGEAPTEEEMKELVKQKAMEPLWPE